VEEQSPGLALRLEKALAVPREVVFAACVEPDRLATWWGPSGFASPSIELDVCVVATEVRYELHRDG